MPIFVTNTETGGQKRRKQEKRDNEDENNKELDCSYRPTTH